MSPRAMAVRAIHEWGTENVVTYLLEVGVMRTLKRASVLVGLLAMIGMSLGMGCSSSRSSRAAVPLEEKPVVASAEEAEPLAGLEALPGGLGKKESKDHRIAYTVGPDDVIAVEVRQHPEIGGEFLVSPEGTIFISLIGSVEVEDATTEEIASRLESRLGEFIRDPEVAVSVVAYNSKKVYVLGQVGNPGEHPMRGNMLTVRDAVLLAKLPLDTANLPRVAVITPDEYAPQVRVVNLNDILYKGILRENINLKPGDVVVVHRHLLAKLGKFLEQVLGPTGRLRAAEDLVETFEGRD